MIGEGLRPQGIVSVLQAQIIDNKIFKGFVGIDDCKKKRPLSEEDKTTLEFAAKMIGLFIIKHRLEENANNK